MSHLYLPGTGWPVSIVPYGHLGLEPVGVGGVLLSTPLHASSNFTVSVQLANKRGFKKDSVRTSQESHNFTTTK
jgi:hypothetical protein